MESIDEQIKSLREKQFKADLYFQLRPDLDRILLIPRPIVFVDQINYGPAKSRSYFILDYLDTTVYDLSLPTPITNHGLQSGGRSAIIKDINGEYYRLKGINLKLNKEKGGDRGLCNILEGIYEQLNALEINKRQSYFCAIKPYYLEIIPDFERIKRVSDIDDYVENSKVAEIQEHNSAIKILEQLGGLLKKYKHGEVYAVSAYGIKGDTRLDEVIYLLTQKKLDPNRDSLRKEILSYLCFSAGVTKATLTLSGITWSDDFIDTNNHIGNFVVYSQNGVLLTDYTDIANIMWAKDFYNLALINDEPNIALFLDHTEREIKSLEDDFFDEETCSLDEPKKYLHFDDDLRKFCFECLLSGYRLTIAEHQRRTGEIWPNEFDKDLTSLYLTSPSKIRMTITEFDEIMGKLTEPVLNFK